ncbi:MAG: hypothetical protein ACLFM1_08250 [Bacteroidales bacterium]
MSCEKDDNTTGAGETSKKSLMFANSSSDYPDGIDSYVSTNYPEPAVDEVELDKGMELFFELDRNYLFSDYD